MSAPEQSGTRRGLDDRLLGLITVTIVLGLVAADFTGVMRGAFSGSAHTVKAVFADTQQTQPGDLVRIKGVDVGKVTAISLDPGGRSSTVTMQLDSSAGPVYANAGAQLRWRTILGASYAVYLDRGDPAAGDLGSHTIPESRTTNQVEIEDVAAVDQGAARAGLQTMPGELAQALRDPKPVASSFGTLAAVSPALTGALDAVRGQVPDADLRAVIASGARTVQALDTSTNEMRTLVAGAAATLQATASVQADIRNAIAFSPAALQSTDTTVKQLDTTLGLADPLIAALAPAAPQAGPTLAELHPTVVGLDQLLRNAVPLLYALRPAVNSLARAAHQGVPLLNGLTPSLDRFNNKILPYLGETDPETKHTTTEMIGGTFTGLGSGAPAQEDANGHFIRFPATSGSSPVYLPCQIYYGNPDAQKLIECESLQQALQTFLAFNPLGTPASRLARTAR